MGETWYHALRSLRFFGDHRLEVHLWLDQFWEGDFDDHSHRYILHSPRGRELCGELFGEQSLKHFDRHMIDDMLMYSDGSWYDDWIDELAMKGMLNIDLYEKLPPGFLANGDTV